MTDYSPEALRDLVKEIAHRAIKTQLYLMPGGYGWDGDADSGFHGAGWSGSLPPVTGPGPKTRLRIGMPGLSPVAGMPPGLVKVGDGTDEVGQPYTEYEVDAWASIYEPWVSRVQDAFRGWDDLPEPTDFDGPIEAVRRAVTEITPAPSGPGLNNDEGDFGSAYSNVDLQSALDTINTTVGDYSDVDLGLLITAFLRSYGPTRVTQVMNNQGQVAIVLGMSLLGEKKIWEGAQKDIMAIAEKARDSMRPGGAGGDPINLEVVKAFADLVKNFVPGAVSTAIDVGEGVLDLADTLTPDKPEGDDSPPLEGYTIDEVCTSMADLVQKLDQKVYDSELSIINKTLEGMLDYMWNHKATQFHLHPDAGIDPQLASAKGLSVHPENLKLVGYSLVPEVAAFMGRAAEAAQEANQMGAWTRASVGYGYSGPYMKWLEVLNELDKVATGSAHELVEAGRLLAIGAGWLEDTDGWSRAALAGVDDDLQRGQDGWDNSKPKPPPTTVQLPNGKRVPI